SRGVSRRNTYGWARLDPFGGLLSALLLLGVTVWIVVEGVGRLFDPHEVDSVPVMALAVLGLLVNGISALLLSRRSSASLAVRAAVIHLVGDAAGSFGVLVAGVAASFGADWVDGAIAILIALGI